MIPEYVPGSTQYFSCVRPSGHEATSDLMRTVTTPYDRQAPAIEPHW
ncbi:MAG: hypothetical protein M3P95_00025 [Actinomycetota bacterium]|nr:hypothetical protein [Actinomycetota bacterium]